jgi:NDP-sugar pyrophosphorylase family protein
VDDRSDCGSIVADKGGHVLRFVEKAVNRGPRYLSAGIYLIARESCYMRPSPEAVSLETVVLPRWLFEGKDIKVFADPARCVDIGTARALLERSQIPTRNPHVRAEESCQKAF